MSEAVEFLRKKGYVEIEAHTSIGKSSQPMKIKAITLPEGGTENETLLHITSIHRE